jgi:hypothetical protein
MDRKLLELILIALGKKQCLDYVLIDEEWQHVYQEAE